MAPASTGARLGRAAATLLRPRSHPATGTAEAPGGTTGHLGRALGRGAHHLLGSWAGIFRRLGLQVSAILYLAFGASFGAAAVKSWRAQPHTMAASLTNMPPMTGLEFTAALVLLYFGVSSLARAGRHS